MSTHLCTFSRATPGTDPAPTPATGPQPLSALTICVKYEPSSSVGYIMLCSQILSQNSIDIMKILAKICSNLFLTEALHGTCFSVVRCGAKMLCAVCGESAAAGWKRICGPRQDAAKLHWKLLLHQLTVTVPSHELKSFPPCPSRPFHNAPSLSLTSLPSYHQKNRYSHKKCISWCDCEQQEQGETILGVLVLCTNHKSTNRHNL